MQDERILTFPEKYHSAATFFHQDLIYLIKERLMLFTTPPNLQRMTLSDDYNPIFLLRIHLNYFPFNKNERIYFRDQSITYI